MIKTGLGSIWGLSMWSVHVLWELQLPPRVQRHAVSEVRLTDLKLPIDVNVCEWLYVSHPMTSEIGSSSPATLNWISARRWMDK